MGNPTQEHAYKLGSALYVPRPYSRFRHVLWVLIVFVATALAFCFLDRKAFNYLELFAYNMRMAVRSARDHKAIQAARKKIVLVPLSDESFASGQLPAIHPLPRNYHARVIRDLSRAGVKAIVFDLIFAEEKPEQDAELASAARSSGKVIWACLPQGKDDWGEEQVLEPNAALVEACSRVGHCLVSQDLELPVSDRVQEAVVCNGRRVPALSLLAAAMARGWDSRPTRRTRTGVRLGDIDIPLDETGHFRISYLGKPGETFPSIPYEQVYGGAVNDDFYRKNHFFRDKIVLIGDTTSISKDRLYTPMGDMDGVEIHAHAIATLLQRRFVREAAPWVNVAAIWVLAGMVCILASIGSVYRVAASVVGLLIVYFAANVWLFSERGLWLHLAAPMAAAAACATGLLGERAVTNELEKKRMRWLLRRYVSPEVAEHIIANPDACVLGGKRVAASVLFADIRGFASMSENLTPEAVVGVLNDYFDSMTAVAFKHGGTVDKFVGDAIMVLFGVPVPYPDHARRAVSAALDMQSALLDLQKKWQADGQPVADIGIGINTGVMVAGSIGSTQRLDFTVIGDEVNTASRVTDFNKQTQTRILASESTYEAVKDEVVARGPLSGTVKDTELTAYEIIGWREERPEANT